MKNYYDSPYGIIRRPLTANQRLVLHYMRSRCMTSSISDSEIGMIVGELSRELARGWGSIVARSLRERKLVIFAYETHEEGRFWNLSSFGWHVVKELNI